MTSSLCPICHTDHGKRGVPCRPKRCDVCLAIVTARDCAECGALHGRHHCSPGGPCACWPNRPAPLHAGSTTFLETPA